MKRCRFGGWLVAVALCVAATAGELRYSYDDADRLTEVLCETSQAKVSWKYDAAHNVVEHKVFTDTDGDGIADYWEILHFGNLTTCNASTDWDGDGLSDYAEYVAGTDPTSDESTFGFGSTSAPSATPSNFMFVVRWASQTNRTYTIECATNLMAGFDMPLATSIAATPPVNEYAHTNATGIGFYRVGIQEGN
jgi:hypothetical protein